MDSEKAYDSVWRDVLFFKLIDKISNQFWMISISELQRMIDIRVDYNKRWLMKYNVKKPVIMILDIK